MREVVVADSSSDFLSECHWGLSLRQIQQLLGHESIETTLTHAKLAETGEQIAAVLITRVRQLTA